MTIAEQIDSLLKERNLSRRQLAIKAGIPTSTFQSAMQRNGNMSVDMLEKVAKALDVPLESLLNINISMKYIDSDGNSYPVRTEWEEIFIDVVDDISKHMTEETLKKEIDTCFEILDFDGKRELFKKAIELSQKQREAKQE